MAFYHPSGHDIWLSFRKKFGSFKLLYKTSTVSFSYNCLIFKFILSLFGTYFVYENIFFMF